VSFTDPTYLAEVLQGILTTLSTAYTAAGRPVDRVFRSAAAPAWDCSLLAIWPAVRVVAPGTRTDPNPMLRQFRLALDASVVVTRCMAAAQFDGVPPVTAVDADGAALAADMWIMARTLTEGAATATLGVPGGCTVARVTPVTTPPPSGGLYAVTTTLEVTLG
jgi:hypothetical protein